MTKLYEEKLEDLEVGLMQLENMKPKKYMDYKRIKLAKEIQEARIEGFKSGYDLRDKEVKEQKILKIWVEK